MSDSIVKTSTLSREGRRLRFRVPAFDEWLLSRLPFHGVPIEIRLWTGAARCFSPEPPIGSLWIADRATLLGLLFNTEMAFGEAYRDGRARVDGDLVGLLERVFKLRDPLAGHARHRRGRVGALPRGGNTPARARLNVHHHYDLGNAFYRLWLDRDMVYTCAYFPSPDDELETAQRAKMDLVCRKLGLQPGERVVEAGCGWGALARHMAREYGATVRAFNISHEQIKYARAQAAREHLAGSVEFIEDDYRNISGTYDLFVSVGMLEHVGQEHFAAFGDVIHRALTPDGRGLLHFIGRNRPRPLDPWIRKRIFPGGYPPTLDEVLHEVLEPWDLSVLDTENLRLHYALTIEHWRHRFDRHEADIQAMYDESFMRTWRLYLASAQAAFRSGWMQLFQIVFARGRSNRIPWRRNV